MSRLENIIVAETIVGTTIIYIIIFFFFNPIVPVIKKILGIPNEKNVEMNPKNTLNFRAITTLNRLQINVTRPDV
ncbi:MAG: hypothetical protein ACFNYD_04005 [Bacteroides sp.]